MTENTGVQHRAAQLIGTIQGSTSTVSLRRVTRARYAHIHPPIEIDQISATSHLDRVEAAEWPEEELPSGLRSIGYLGIENVGNFRLPSTLERIDELEIEWSRFALPPSVRSIGKLRIWYGDAALTCEGVTRFGEVNLTNADFVFPVGTRDIAALTASASSVTLPSTLRRIGDIDFRNDYDKANDVTWAEGVVDVGTIRMEGPTFFRVPFSVAAITAVLVGPDAQLVVPASTLIKGEETIRNGGRLARI